MNNNQLDIYDRNMRVWGIEVQEKLLKSACYILNPKYNIMSELIKNLLLIGVDLYVVKDKTILIDNQAIYTTDCQYDNNNHKIYIDNLIATIQYMSNITFIKQLSSIDFIDCLICNNNNKNNNIIFFYCDIFTSIKQIDLVISFANINKYKNINYYISFNIGKFGFFISNSHFKNLNIRQINEEFFKKFNQNMNSKQYIKDILLTLFHYYIYFLILLEKHNICNINNADTNNISKVNNDLEALIINILDKENYFKSNNMKYLVNKNTSIKELLNDMNSYIEEYKSDYENNFYYNNSSFDKKEYKMELSYKPSIDQVLAGIISLEVISNTKATQNNIIKLSNKDVNLPNDCNSNKKEETQDNKYYVYCYSSELQIGYYY